MNESAQLARASKAKAILESELFIEAFGKVREAILQKIEAADVNATEQIKDLKLMLKSLHYVKVNLEQVMTTGKLIELQRERDDWRSRAIERIRSWRQ